MSFTADTYIHTCALLKLLSAASSNCPVNSGDEAGTMDTGLFESLSLHTSQEVDSLSLGSQVKGEKSKSSSPAKTIFQTIKNKDFLGVFKKKKAKNISTQQINEAKKDLEIPTQESGDAVRSFVDQKRQEERATNRYSRQVFMDQDLTYPDEVMKVVSKDKIQERPAKTEGQKRKLEETISDLEDRNRKLQKLCNTQKTNFEKANKELKESLAQSETMQNEKKTRKRVKAWDEMGPKHKKNLTSKMREEGYKVANTTGATYPKILGFEMRCLYNQDKSVAEIGKLLEKRGTLADDSSRAISLDQAAAICLSTELTKSKYEYHRSQMKKFVKFPEYKSLSTFIKTVILGDIMKKEVLNETGTFSGLYIPVKEFVKHDLVR